MPGRRKRETSIPLSTPPGRPLGTSLSEEALQKDLRVIGEGAGNAQTQTPIIGGDGQPIGHQTTPIAAGTYQGPITVDQWGHVTDAADTGALPEEDQIQRQLLVSLVAVSNSTPTEITDKSVARADLRYFDEVRLTVKNSNSGSGATYTGQHWNGASWQSIGASQVIGAVADTGDTSAWGTLAVGARADVSFRVLGTGGAGDIDVSFCALEFRRRGPAIYNERIGAWSNVTAYEVGNIVEHNGSSFVALQAHTGDTPNPAADTSNWGRLAIKGDTGATGPQGPPGSSPVVEVTGTSQAIVAGTRYIPNNAGLVTLTLPAVAALGAQVFIRGKGVGGWLLAQNAGQTIHGSSDTTTGTGGSLASQTRYDCVTLEVITADTDFLIINQRGTLSLI